MLELHTTREGHTMLIAQMDNKHLVNMINVIIRRIKELKEMASVPQDAYILHLYGMEAINYEEAARQNRRAIQRLYPYLAEALLRGLVDEVRPQLTEAVGRSAALETRPLLPSTVHIRPTNDLDQDLDEIIDTEHMMFGE